MSLIFAFREKENPNLAIATVPFNPETGLVASEVLDQFVSNNYREERRYALWNAPLERWLPIPSADDMRRTVVVLAAEKKTYSTFHIWVDMPEQWSLGAAVIQSLETLEGAAETAAEAAA